MNNDKKPSRKHDWTTTRILALTLCIQVATLVLQIVNLLCEPVFETVKPRRGARIQTYFGGYYEKTACESYVY